MTAHCWLECVSCGAIQAMSVWPECKCGGAQEIVYEHSVTPGDSASLDKLLPEARGAWMSLGEGGTPLISSGSVHLKCEYISPTGSYKDRVAALGVTLGVKNGCAGWLGTSSGNAGASFSAYA